MPRNPVLRVILCISAAALLAALLASYGGRLHPLGDSLAVFRPAMALLLALIAFAFRCWWRIALLASALFAAAPILWLMRPQSAPAPSVTVYQKNLLFRRDDPAELLAELRASNADVILLEEVSTANLPIPEALRDRYRFQIICPAHSVGAVAILSVHPMSDEYCREGAGFTMARIAHPAGAFTAVAVHLHWPYPFGQEPQVNNILADLAGAARPMIIGGDFNMVPWTGAPRRIARATDTHNAGPVFPTLFVKGYPLPIDHVLVDAGLQAAVERRPRLGSDHYGVLARIGR